MLYIMLHICLRVLKYNQTHILEINASSRPVKK